MRDESGLGDVTLGCGADLVVGGGSAGADEDGRELDGGTSLGTGSGLGDGDADGDGDGDSDGDADGPADDGLEAAELLATRGPRVGVVTLALAGLPCAVSTNTSIVTPARRPTVTAPPTAIAERKLMSSIRASSLLRSLPLPLTTQHDTGDLRWFAHVAVRSTLLPARGGAGG